MCITVFPIMLFMKWMIVSFLLQYFHYIPSILQLLSFLSEISTVRLIVVRKPAWFLFTLNRIVVNSTHYQVWSWAFSFAFPLKQVVGGMEDQMPSLSSSTGVQVITYSKLLSQVIDILSCRYALDYFRWHE